MQIKSTATGEIKTAHQIHRIFTLPDGSASIELRPDNVGDLPSEAITMPPGQWAELNARYEPMPDEFIGILPGNGNYIFMTSEDIAKHYTIISGE